MNLLAKVKNSNKYDLVTDSLTSSAASCIDVEGTTVLLSGTGTSWEYTDSGFSQIEVQLDNTILSGIYSFLVSMCNSIGCDFVKLQMSSVYQDVALAVDSSDVVTLSNLSEAPKIKEGDFFLLIDYADKYTTGDYVDSSDWDYQIELAEDLYGITLPDDPIVSIWSRLAVVTSTTSSSVSFSNVGVDVREPDEARTMGLFYVDFPQDFLDAAIKMYGYDLFIRDDKEKRQERLGNYTYINFEPTQYYGSGEYPKHLQDKVKYWQVIHL